MSDTTTEYIQGHKPFGLPLNDLLGLAPAYLGNGHQAYAAGVVAAWPEHNRARFSVLLYTGQQLESAVAAERERIAKHFDSRDKGTGGFYEPHEPAEIIRALGPNDPSSAAPALLDEDTRMPEGVRCNE